MNAGPLEVIDPSAYDLAPAEVETPAEVAALEAEFTALLGDLDGDTAGLAGLLAVDPRAELERAHAEAEEGIYQDLDCGDENDLADAALAATEVDELVIDAYAALPGEAWQPVPDPYEEPHETGGLVEDRGPTDPLSPGAPITPAPAAPPSFEVGAELRNLTGANDRLFAVGDRWKIMVSGPAGCPVTCTAWRDGEPLAPLAAGYTDQGGWFTLQGEMGLEHLGYWVEQWAVGGVAAPSVISFMVK